MTGPPPTAAEAAAIEALDVVTASLPGAEVRPGQREMAALVASAIDGDRHLVVQAGTGTGKTLAYLVPAVVAGRRTIVATATKALQDQLATKDLPFLAATLEPLGHGFAWAVLKGRNNYLCRQRLAEVRARRDGQLDLDQLSAPQRKEIERIALWSATTPTGDRADLDWNPGESTWRAVSVGSDECPGAERCPFGADCFAEEARRRAQASDVIVVNTHLYGLHVGSDGAILPDHEVVVFDEAHVLEDTMSDTVGVQIAPGRFVTVAATVRRILDDPNLIASIADLATAARSALGPLSGRRLPLPLPDTVTDLLDEARLRLTRVAESVQAISTEVDDAVQRRLRAVRILTRSIEALDAVAAAGSGTVAFVSGTPDDPCLELAPLDVGPVLADGVWQRRTAVLTSATVPSSLARRVGLPGERTVEARVESPFDYGHQALLYCAMHLPPPRSDRFRDAVADELVSLIAAAGGRTLALFTSWAAMDHAVEAVSGRVGVPILTQRDLPKPALVRAFAESEETCLFATTGLFQGIDVPGRTLSLVVIDKLPFPRPDDPLLSARREQLGPAAFTEIDVPRAATLLAQAGGRLIRSSTDRGVVAVLDRRLGSAGYRWDLVTALPPMRRTRDRAEVEAFLRDLTRS